MNNLIFLVLLNLVLFSSFVMSQVESSPSGNDAGVGVVGNFFEKLDNRLMLGCYVLISNSHDWQPLG